MCPCAGAVLFSSDSLCPEVSVQQRGASKVPLSFGGRCEEDIGQPTGKEVPRRLRSLFLLSGAALRCVFVQQCLPDPNNYHEFCRLLARLKSNYQLGELVKVENYPEVIRLIANFTVTSLQVSVKDQLQHCVKQQEVLDSNGGFTGGFLCSSTGSLPPTVSTTC